jgi:hypothetical protein
VRSLQQESRPQSIALDLERHILVWLFESILALSDFSATDTTYAEIGQFNVRVWDRSEMKIRQTFVHGKIQLGAKTKLSKSTVTLHPILAQLLKDWRAETPYAGDNDYVFASRKTSGKTPRYGPLWLKTTYDLPLSGQACLR